MVEQPGIRTMTGRMVAWLTLTVACYVGLSFALYTPLVIKGPDDWHAASNAFYVAFEVVFLAHQLLALAVAIFIARFFDVRTRMAWLLSVSLVFVLFLGSGFVWLAMTSAG